ncbi:MULTISPECIES: hypothetical protein [Cyanophyceae]|uniref:hypothetical protein n=1 Tax=Cyanophyceae TaxID=3028117 RepID=UPI00168640EA|nr:MULTISPECIES: hypothetical protein [Cyanophyceae]MBD1914715.1 hypothetical protein [Phormidium sp. FACHB-77]MBD2030818.1 hypothetical protein [Phormidium sp. FACHB-322]MBD2052417.1 hypothetical protein [Leptolyngbya sp. FACHB-60]
MFHLYFGAFDIVLYLGGIYAAMALSKALCDQMDEAEAAQNVTTTAPQVAPMQPIAPHLVAPATKRDEVSVRVSAN